MKLRDDRKSMEEERIKVEQVEDEENRSGVLKEGTAQAVEWRGGPFSPLNSGISTAQASHPPLERWLCTARAVCFVITTLFSIFHLSLGATARAGAAGAKTQH